MIFAFSLFVITLVLLIFISRPLLQLSILSSFIIFSMSSLLSVIITTSSAKRRFVIFFPSIASPLFSQLRSLKMVSSTALKRSGEIGHPWRTPLCILNSRPFLSREMKALVFR
uniref:Uncharacterized protein n=1 Tax=Cacopsylla melanoneura TaxID=428564 RepID=A0A8D8SDW2_9HEMI